MYDIISIFNVTDWNGIAVHANISMSNLYPTSITDFSLEIVKTRPVSDSIFVY
jgi:hypothetical protein